jgi:hypothetical protein
VDYKTLEFSFLLLLQESSLTLSLIPAHHCRVLMSCCLCECVCMLLSLFSEEISLIVCLM